MSFYMSDPHASDHHIRGIWASSQRGKKARFLNPLVRGPFGKPNRRFDRVWVDFRAKTRGPHRAPRITIWRAA